MDVLAFIAVALALAGQMGDCYTTEIALAHGMSEGNPIARWLTSHIGNTGLTLLKCVGAAIVLPMVTMILGGYELSAIIAGVIAVIGFVAAGLNYRLMRKHNIPL